MDERWYLLVFISRHFGKLGRLLAKGSKPMGTMLKYYESWGMHMTRKSAYPAKRQGNAAPVIFAFSLMSQSQQNYLKGRHSKPPILPYPFLARLQTHFKTFHFNERGTKASVSLVGHRNTNHLPLWISFRKVCRRQYSRRKSDHDR